MYSVDVAIIGGGQAGLAMSRCLSERNIDHLVFERGGIGQRWKTSTWESLRLLTPNWMNVLPGQAVSETDPFGFMGRDEHIWRLETYARRNRAPVVARTEVMSVSASGNGYCLVTSRGTWQARSIVIATGQCDVPRIPAAAQALSAEVLNLHSSQYKRPADLPNGNVLVVGASSSGVQIADEVRRSGREVILSVGKHIRLPRRWNGRDIFWWFDRMGLLGERTSDVPNLDKAIRQPSMQLVGRPDRRNIDLSSLQAIGVRIAGHLNACDGDHVQFANDLAASVSAADDKQRRLLERINAFSRANSCKDFPASIRIGPESDPREISLRGEGITTVIWATGFMRRFPWLDLPVLSRAGELAHVDGVTAMPGVYALGYRFLRKRDSNFIGGVGTDAIALSQQVAGYLDRAASKAA